MKHFEQALLAYAEIPKDHVQDIFHVNPSREATQGLGGDSQFLGQQVFTVGINARRATQRGHHILQGASVALAGHQCGLRSDQICLRVLGQLLKQGIEAFAGLGRKIERRFTSAESKFTRIR